MKFDAILLAAGRGKRMKPFSDVIAKPMLPIHNKPLLSIIAEQLLHIGAEKLIITVSKSTEAEIKQYFANQPYKDKVVYCLQEPPQGTADAIYKAGLLATSDVVVSMAGDNVFSEAFCQTLVSEYFRTKDQIQCIMTLLEVTKEQITKLASVTLDSAGLITSIVEKPKLEEVTSTLASLSVYIFDKALLSYFRSVELSPRGEYEAPDAFLAMLATKRIVLKGLITKDTYIHISNPLDLWKYNIESLAPEENKLEDDLSIATGTTLTKCVVGKNVTIGKSCALKECLILPGVIIPANTHITKAVLGKSSKGYEQYNIPEQEH